MLSNSYAHGSAEGVHDGCAEGVAILAAGRGTDGIPVGSTPGSIKDGLPESVQSRGWRCGVRVPPPCFGFLES